MWDLIVSVPDRCLSFYFGSIATNKVHSKNTNQTGWMVFAWGTG